MLTVGNERFLFKVRRRNENDKYTWEQNWSIVFKGRPANQIEKKNYRIMQGVNGNTDSVYVIASNLPKDIKPYDKVLFMGKEWTVMSVGYYFDEARFVNPGIMNPDHIIARCPKGINLQ